MSSSYASNNQNSFINYNNNNNNNNTSSLNSNFTSSNQHQNNYNNSTLSGFYGITNNQINNTSNSNSINQTLVEMFLNKTQDIICIPSLSNNEDFIYTILNIISKLEDLINFYGNNSINNWRLIIKICNILGFDDIYKLNISMDQLVIKIFNISKKLIVNDCFVVKVEALKIMAKLSKSKIVFDEIIKFVEVEISLNKNFYNRRLYFYFFQELTKNFSYKFLYDKGLIDELIRFINDNNQILPRFLKILKSFFPLVLDDKIKFLVYNKLETLRKQIQGGEIIDNEVFEV